MIEFSFGVIIGRFQTDLLHVGHECFIGDIQNENHTTIVLIGDRKSPQTANNPLSFETRSKMIMDEFPNVLIGRIFDCRDDTEWSENVDKEIDKISSNVLTSLPATIVPKITLYGGRDSFISHYNGKYKTELYKCDFVNHNSTNIRESIKNISVENHNADFRRGIIHAYQNLTHRHYLSVDVAIQKEENSYIFLMGKKPGETQWRFPGGFVDPYETPEHAAKRELFEECNETIEGKLQYIDSFQVKDWRLRNAEGVDQITMLFYGFHSWGMPTPGDDLEIVQWIDVRDQYFCDNIIPEHIPLVKSLLNHLCPK